MGAMLQVLELYRASANPNLLVESVHYVGHGEHVHDDDQFYKEDMSKNVTTMMQTPKRASNQTLKVIAVICYGAHKDMRLGLPGGVYFFGGDAPCNTDVCKVDTWVYNSLTPDENIQWKDDWGCTWSWRLTP